MLRSIMFSVAAAIVALLFSSIAFAVDVLYPNQTLWQGQRLQSTNGCFRLDMQIDGNLVIYRNSNNQPMWATNTQYKGAIRATMQGDGNFVLYNRNNSAIWNTGTWNHEGSRIIMQNDGNLVIYAWNSWRPIWASNTVRSCYASPTEAVDESVKQMNAE